jgi:uncharacterized integral membrane protein
MDITQPSKMKKNMKKKREYFNWKILLVDALIVTLLVLVALTIHTNKGVVG